MSGHSNILLSYGEAAAGNGLLTNLESYYKCDESSGTILDAHGTYDSTAASVTYGATGVINNALDFESSSSNYVDLGAIRDYKGFSEVSVSAWINLESLPSSGVQYQIYSNSLSLAHSQLFLNYNNVSGTHYLVFGTFDNINFGKRRRYAVTLSTSTWYHVLGVHDGSNWKLYLDGSEVSTDVITGAITASAGRDAIGALYLGTFQRSFDGLIDEVGIWSRELSGTDAAALYNSGSPLGYPSFTS